MGKKVRRDTLETWLRRRDLTTSRAGQRDTTLYWHGYAVRVVGAGGRIPGGLTVGARLDADKRETGRDPVLVRAIDPDPGRCLLTLRLDDALPLMYAYEEEIHR